MSTRSLSLSLLTILSLWIAEGFAWKQSVVGRVPPISRLALSTPAWRKVSTMSTTPAIPEVNVARTSAESERKPWNKSNHTESSPSTHPHQSTAHTGNALRLHTAGTEQDKTPKLWKKPLPTNAESLQSTPPPVDPRRKLTVQQWQASKSLTQELGTLNPAREIFDAVADQAIAKSSEQALLLWRNYYQTSPKLSRKEALTVLFIALIGRVHYCIRHHVDDRLVSLLFKPFDLSRLLEKGIRYDICAQNVLLYKVFQNYAAAKSSVQPFTSQNLYRMLYSCYVAGDFELALELIQNYLESSDISALITSFAMIVKRNGIIDNVEGFIRFVREARVEIERKGGSINAGFIDTLKSVFAHLKSTAGGALIVQWSRENQNRIKSITEIESISSSADVTTFLLLKQHNNSPVDFERLANHIFARDLLPLDAVALKAFTLERKRCPESRPINRLFAASILSELAQSEKALSPDTQRRTLWSQRLANVDGTFESTLSESLIELICERLEQSRQGSLGSLSAAVLVAKEELVMRSQRLKTPPALLMRFYKVLASHFSWNELDWRPKELIRIIMACISTGNYPIGMGILQNLSLINRGNTRYILLSSLCPFIDRDSPIMPELPAFIIRAHDLLLTHEVPIDHQLLIVFLEAMSMHGTREDCLQVVEWMKSRIWPLKSDAYELLLRKSLATNNAEWTKALLAEIENHRVSISSETLEEARKGFESWNDQEGLQQLFKFKFSKST